MGLKLIPADADPFPADRENIDLDIRFELFWRKYAIALSSVRRRYLRAGIILPIFLDFYATYISPSTTNFFAKEWKGTDLHQRKQFALMQICSL